MKAVKLALVAAVAAGMVLCSFGEERMIHFEGVAGRSDGSCASLMTTFSSSAVGAKLYLASGDGDGGDYRGDWEQCKLVLPEITESGSPCCVSIPRGVRFARLFCEGATSTALTLNSSLAQLTCARKLDENSKLIIVFRPDTGNANNALGIVGSRKTAYEDNFSINQGAWTAGKSDICLDFNDSGTTQSLETRLKVDVTEEIKDHWFRAEVSAKIRRLVDLNTGVAWTNDNPAASSYSFKTPLDCGIYNIQCSASSVFKIFGGAIAWVEIWQNDNVVASLSPQETANSTWCFHDDVTNEKIGPSSGSLTACETPYGSTCATKTLNVGGAVTGSGRQILSVTDGKTASGGVRCHRLSFGPSQGKSCLLVRASGTAPYEDLWSWDKVEFVDGVLSKDVTGEVVATNVFEKGQSLCARYYLVDPMWAAVGAGAEMRTNLKLTSGDSVSVEFRTPNPIGNSTGIVGYRDGANDKNIALSYAAMAFDADYNNSGGTDGYKKTRLHTSDGFLVADTWFRAELSPEARTIMRLSDGVEEKDTRTDSYASFETGEMLLFYVGGSPGLWSRFLGAISRCTVKRGDDVRADFIAYPKERWSVCGFIDAVSHEKFESSDSSKPFTIFSDELVYGASQVLWSEERKGLAIIFR